jgi:hypothetical protein
MICMELSVQHLLTRECVDGAEFISMRKVACESRSPKAGFWFPLH